MKSYFQEAMKQNLERDAKEKKAQQSNQASAPRTKRNLVAPFKTDYLNQKYKDAVADLGQYTSPRNAIEEAYKAVSTMRDTVFAYDGAAKEKDAKAAILAGEKKMNKSLRESRTRFQLEGKNYGEMIALAKSKGYRDARENLQDMARRGLVSDQQAAMAIASGDEGGTEAERHVQRWADALKSYKGNAQDYFLIYQDPAKAMQALRDDKTMRAMTFEQQDILTELLQESGALDSFDTAEQEKLAADYAAREMTYMQEAMRSLQNQEEWQDIIDYSRKNTLEGAREWVESEPESQEAKNNLYFAEKKAEYDAIAPGEDDYDANNGDRLYQYINGNKQIIDDANLVANMAGGSDPWYKYRYMTEDQVKKYNAIVKQKGLEEGKKYLDEYLSYALNERQNEEAKQQMYDLAQSGPVGAVAASAASVPMNLARGFGYADVLLQKLMNRLTGSERPVDYNRSLNQIGAGADAARQGVMDSVDWNINVLGRDVDVFDFLYGTAMSGADSLAAGAFGQTMGAVILGSSAAQSTMQDVHERGGNDGQALVSGLAAGIFEELFEKVSLGNLFADLGSMNKEGLKGALKMIARETGVNFSEEFFTEVANVAFDKIYMGDLSEATQKYEYYRSLGLTDEQASAKMASDIGAQFLEAGLGGAVMGAGFGAMGAVNATRNNSKVTKQAGDNIIQAGTRERLKKIASAFGEDSEAGRLAKTYNAETAESKETGKLFRAVLEEMPQGEQRTVKFREDMMGLVAAEVAERLLELGENEGDAADAAMAVTALWANAELEAADYLALSRSDHAIELAEQLLGMEAADASQSAESAANAEQDAWDAEQDITTEAQAEENAADAAARALEAEGPARRTEKREAPARISLDDEGGVKIQENGKEIDLDESAMTDSQKTLVLDSQGMQPETAAAMRGAYAEGGDVSAHEYGIGFKRAVEAYKRGETPTGVYAGALTETQLEAARAAAEGENARAREQTLQAAQETAQALGLRALTEETKNEAGAVIASAKGKPDEFQAAQIKLLDRVAKELGVQVRLYDTLKSPGGAKANASYAQGTNIINLALDADNGLLTKAVSHELYHFAKEWNAEGAERLSALVLGTLEGKEGYDLKARIQEKIAEYEEGGVILTEAAAREEIVGDGLLDYIGTAENFAALAKADRSLAERIKSWVSEMAGRIRRLIGELTGKEAEALRDDLSYLEARDKMMQGVLQKAAENLRDAQRGMYGSAKTDTAVKEYQAEMRNAMNAQEREEALNGLVSKMMERTQRAYFAAHPEADLTATMEKMKRGLLAYGQGKTDVETALKKEGLSAPRAGTHTMYVMSYIGQQAALLEEQGQKYSIETFEKNGRTFSYVKAERQVITGDDPQAWGKQVENYINSEIRKGKDVTFYTENGVPLTVTKDTAGKATYWNTDQSGNRVSEKEYGIKLRIESHIDEAAQVSKGKGNQKIDKKSHSFANNGWNYRKAFFEDFDGNYYSFEISVGKNGKINTIYNVNNIKKEAESPNTLKGAQPKKTTVGLTASTPSISEDSENVNGKFSLSSEVEEQKNLIAVHNLTEEKLEKALELGGFPMPSIAITKASMGHQNFGDISLIFGRETIDPKQNRKNMAYSADAWTPTFPQLDYKIDDAKERALADWARKLEIPQEYRNRAVRFVSDLEDQAMRYGGESGLVKAAENNPGMQAAYLAEKGETIEIEKRTQAKESGFSPETVEKAKRVIDLMGGDVQTVRKMPFNQIWDEYGEQLKEIFPSLQKGRFNLQRIMSIAVRAAEYAGSGTETVQVDDYAATERKMREKIDQADFRAWLEEKLKGVIAGKGVYNNREIFTASGNRRSFDQLHWEPTLENIAKAMAGQRAGNSKNVTGFHGVKTLRAATAETFKSVEQMHARENRLQAMTQEQQDALTERLSDRLMNLTGKILEHGKQTSGNSLMDMDTVGEILTEIGEKAYTEESIQRDFAKYSRPIDQATAGEIKDLLDEISQMPVNMFEAKPERAVGFNEVRAAIVPDSANQEIVDALEGYGVEVIRYAEGNEEQRLEALNSMDALKFSVAEEQNGQTQLPDVTEDAELSAQAAGDEDMRAALMLVQRLYDTARNGEGYLALNGRGAIQAGDWQKRVEGIRDRLLSETGSGYGKGALTRRLNTLFAAMDEGTQSVGDLLMYARETGKKLLENADWAKGVQDEATAEALRILKTNKFYLTEDMKSEIRGTFGSVQNFMRKNFGKLAIRAKAENGNAGANVSLAEVWTESLSDLMPGTFTADATEADMPIILNAWLETVQGRENSNYYGNNIPQMETDIGLQLMLDYYNLPGALKSEKETEAALLEEYESKLQDIRQQYRRKYEEQVSRGAARESKRKTLGEISRNVKYLNTRIVNESDTRHVPDALKGAVTRFMDSFLNDTSVFDRERLRELRDAYARMQETGANEDSRAAWAYDDDIKNMLERMEKTIAGRGLSQLTQDELEMVRDVVGNLKKMVVEGNEITINGRKQTVDHAGNMALTELKSKENVKHEKLTNTIYKTTTPFYFFKNLGGEFKTLFDDMRKGQGKWSGMMGKAKEYLDAQLKEHHVNDWLWTGDNLVFTTDRGEKIELDKGLAMALYATWKRETLNKAQNANHLRMGGFMYPKWAQEKIKTQGVDVNRPHALTAGDMAKIEGYLGKSGIGFVDGMVKYLSNDMAQAGNEVSMALFGYRKFTEGYYFPYASSREYIATDVTRGPGGESQEKTLKSWGAAKKLTERANNPIMIDNFIDVWAKHVNQMATYSSFTVAMDNMNRLYNYKTGVMEDATPESVRVELKRAFGEGAEKYIATLMKDIAGGMRPDERAGMGKTLSLFKKGAVSASASVAIQQPSAIMRAMALISPKYFVDAPKNPMKSWRELTEYSGVARVKEMGRFDTMTGQSSTEWLTSDVKDESAWKRAADFADNLAGWAPEKADQVTWGKLWETVKKEQEAAGVDITTKEGLQKCGERFDEVADATQVYDSVLSKSEIMRGQTIAAKMITAFMAEPTVSFNLLADAIMHMGDTTYQGRVTVKRAAAAYTANVILNAMLKSLITGFRKDDDNEKTAVERYVAEVAENIMSDMNPLTLIPLVQDAVNIFQGYDVKRTDMTVVSDLYEGVKTLFDENKSLELKVEKGLGSVAAIFGVPLRNIARDARTLMNLFSSRPISETDASAIRYGVLEGIPGMPGIFTPYESKNAAYYQRMANAYFADDAAEYENLRRYMTTRKGATENAVSTGARNAVKRMLLAGKIDEDQALQYLMDMEEKSASDAYWMIQEWMGGDDYAKYDDFYEAVNTGKGLQAAIRSYTENGVEKKTLASRITAEYKEEYIRLYKVDKRKFAELQARLLTAYAALGYDREKKKKDMEAWLKEK